MYDHFLRNNTTNRLQADLRSTMKAYDSDKERLSHQLANLQNAERSHTNMSVASSMDLSSNTSVTLTPRKFYRAPNLAAGSISSGGTGSYKSGTTERKWKDRKEHADKMKKEKDLLKLPVIHSASSKRSEWYSGKFLQSSPQKERPLYALEPLPGINAAKALLADSMKIPSIYDPSRTDTAIDTTKTKKGVKKVTFADEKHGTLLSISQIEAKESESKCEPKNFEGKGPVPRLNLKTNQFSHMSRPLRPRKTSLLPPLQISPSEIRQNPHKVTAGVNHWKNLYSNIVDPEQKTKALADIFSALRLKKYENEQAMKYGNSPRPMEKDELVKEFLSMNVSERIAYRDENGHTRKGLVPTPRSSSVSRLSNGHPNTLQLQKYLQQMSRSRKFMEQLHDQQCSRASQHTLQQIATPISVKG
ncbi:uncharacterized protein LOC123536426 [Mercenaria mercenaria]|uniref:uncharacterized protein LOC123536426 n=1 Tax=Mercenaria mercenaria TaxID=6596 RepID=UPI00234F1360|nr:uncharacterized protein LOC123536426 [Mercenaria mercenaria]XP_045175545.2 uncharacterized protein LOC123536426 [Mercenaria mercenaria]